MKRPDAAVPTTQSKGLARDDKFTKAYPALLEFLSDTTWDDGKTRVPGTLTCFVEEGIWKACLNDREASRSVYVSGDTLEACLKSLEKRASGESVPEWRQWKGKKK